MAVPRPSPPELFCCPCNTSVPTGCVTSANWGEYDVTYTFPSGLLPVNTPSVSCSLQVSYGNSPDIISILRPNIELQAFIDSGFAAGGGVSTSNPLSVIYAHYYCLIDANAFDASGWVKIILRPNGCNDEADYNVSWLLEVFYYEQAAIPPDQNTYPGLGGTLVCRRGLVKQDPTANAGSFEYRHGTIGDRFVQRDLQLTSQDWQIISGTNHVNNVPINLKSTQSLSAP